MFPDDPWALPAPQQRRQARRRLLELLPGAYLDANTCEYLRWVGHRRGSQRPPEAEVIRAAMGAGLGCPVRVYQEMPAGPGHLPMKG